MAKVSFDIAGKGSKTTGEDVKKILGEAIREPGKVFENPDPDRTDRNEYYINPRWTDAETWTAERGQMPDYMKAIETLQAERLPEGKKPRKITDNQVLTRNIIVQCGPDAFFPGIREWSQNDISKSTFAIRTAAGPFLEDKARQWAGKIIEHAKEKFGDNLLSAQLHLDEGSPHIHLQIVPVLADGRLSNKEFFGIGQSGFNAWQDRYNTELAEVSQGILDDYEIERAKRGGEKTTEIKTFKKLQEAALLIEAQEQAELYAQIEREQGDIVRPGNAAAVPQPEIKKTLTGKEYIQADDFQQYKKMINAEIVKNSDLIEQLDKQVKSLTIAKGTLERQLAESRQTIKRQEAEMQTTYNEIAKLKDEIQYLPLTQVIEAVYPDAQIERSGHSKNAMVRLGERKIGIKDERLFFDNHDDTCKGAGPISLVMKIENISFREAVEKIGQCIGAEATANVARFDPATRRELERQIAKNTTGQKASAPAPTAQININRLEYLFCEQRKIKPEIVKHLVSTRQIYTDDHLNAVIPRINGGAFVRGTGKPKPDAKPFKRTFGGKDCGPAKLKGPEIPPDGPKEIRLVEGITDAVASLEIFPDCEIWIVGGNLGSELEFPPDIKIVASFNEDEKGRELTAKYMEQYEQITRADFPTYGSDWSEHLMIYKERQTTARKRQEAEQRERKEQERQERARQMQTATPKPKP